MERNLRIIKIHSALAASLAWVPIFVLFTRREHGLNGAIALAAIYYLAAVTLEVPSGWFSDRIGRVITLRVAGVVWIGAHIVFIVGAESFAAVAIGQVLMATGFAALSGTDIALHYDSLESLGRADEFEDRAGRVAAISYLTSSGGTMLGGTLGLFDLRWAFVAALCFAVAQLLAAMQLQEPPTEQRADPILQQVRLCYGLMTSRLLRWIFVYWVGMVVLEHVAFTLAQPYLTEALGRTADDLGATPLVVGAQFAAAAAVGSVAARAAPGMRRRFGFAPTLLMLAVLSGTIVSIMGAVIHAAVIALMVLRSVHGAAAPVLLTAAAAPLVESQRRATYFSLHSLVGRLAYSSVLFGVAAAVGDELTPSLRALTGVAWVVVALVAAAYVAMGRPQPT